MTTEEKDKLYELKYFIDKLGKSHMGDQVEEFDDEQEQRISLPENGVIPRTIFLSPSVVPKYDNGIQRFKDKETTYTMYPQSDASDASIQSAPRESTTGFPFTGRVSSVSVTSTTSKAANQSAPGQG